MPREYCQSGTRHHLLHHHCIISKSRCQKTQLDCFLAKMLGTNNLLSLFSQCRSQFDCLLLYYLISYVFQLCIIFVLYL